jgi:hypothetical protein
MSTPCLSGIRTHNISGDSTDCIDTRSWKSKYHTITTTTAPHGIDIWVKTSKQRKLFYYCFVTQLTISFFLLDHIGGVMVSMLASSEVQSPVKFNPQSPVKFNPQSPVRFNPQSVQIKDYRFSTVFAASLLNMQY